MECQFTNIDNQATTHYKHQLVKLLKKMVKTSESKCNLGKLKNIMCLVNIVLNLCESSNFVKAYEPVNTSKNPR